MLTGSSAHGLEAGTGGQLRECKTHLGNTCTHGVTQAGGDHTTEGYRTRASPGRQGLSVHLLKLQKRLQMGDVTVTSARPRGSASLPWPQRDAQQTAGRAADSRTRAAPPTRKSRREAFASPAQAGGLLPSEIWVLSEVRAAPRSPARKAGTCAEPRRKDIPDLDGGASRLALLFARSPSPCSSGTPDKGSRPTSPATHVPRGQAGSLN